MGFIKRHTGRANYDLLSTYSYYTPGFGGMMMMLLLFIVGALLGNLVLIPFTLIYPEAATTYGMIISYPLMFIPPMLYASAKSRRNEIFETGYALDSKNFGPRGGLMMALVVSLATIAMAFAVEPLNLLLPPMPEYLEKAMEQMLDGPVWVALLSVSVFAPFFEEWLCRGIILRGMLKHTNPTGAILISAVFFAVLHMNPWQAIPAFLLGILFGYVYYKTGSLRLTMLMHCINNTISVILSRIPSFEEAETFMDVLCPWKYTCVYISSALIIISAVIIIAAIPKKPETLGACDKLEPISIN